MEGTMTNYELIDLSATYTDLLSTTYKFWTTTTFALIAAAYIAGPELGTWISIGMAIVYFSLAMGNVFTVRLYTSTIVATVEDLKVLENSSDTLWATAQPMKNTPTNILAPMLITVMVFGSVGSVLYLFYRVGVIG
jgi:hypothetical protein